MKRPIRVRGARRQNVDLDKLAFALLRLVEQLTPEERVVLKAEAGPARSAPEHGDRVGEGKR